MALAREKASTLLFNSRGVPEDYARGLEGRYLVVLDGTGASRFSSSPVPEELVQLFARRSPHAIDAPGGTTILAWYASGREWRGAMSYVPPSRPGDLLSANTVVVFAPEATFGNSFNQETVTRPIDIPDVTATARVSLRRTSAASCFAMLRAALASRRG